MHYSETKRIKQSIATEKFIRGLRKCVISPRKVPVTKCSSTNCLWGAAITDTIF